MYCTPWFAVHGGADARHVLQHGAARHRRCAEELMQNPQHDMSCIMVLRVIGGQDTFVLIQGNYKGSAFGVCLEVLRGLGK
eukprot:1187052-Prorocentrum_minimum.AAC.5